MIEIMTEEPLNNEVYFWLFMIELKWQAQDLCTSFNVEVLGSLYLCRKGCYIRPLHFIFFITLLSCKLLFSPFLHTYLETLDPI